MGRNPFMEKFDYALLSLAPTGRPVTRGVTKAGDLQSRVGRLCPVDR